MQRPVYLPDVVTLALDEALCNGCRMCMKVCPHAVFEMSDGKALIVDRDYCMECGACVRNCSLGAIFVRAGVGCATGIIRGTLTNSEPSCGCSDKASCN